MNQTEEKTPQELAAESVRKLYEGMNSQVKEYDKYLLTLSSGFLILGSGALTGDFLEKASGLGWLVMATGVFLLTIISLIMAYMHVQSEATKVIHRLLDAIRGGQMTEDDLNQIFSETPQSGKYMHRWNIVNGSLFIAGVVIFWISLITSI